MNVQATMYNPTQLVDAFPWTSKAAITWSGIQVSINRQIEIATWWLVKIQTFKSWLAANSSSDGKLLCTDTYCTSELQIDYFENFNRNLLFILHYKNEKCYSRLLADSWYHISPLKGEHHSLPQYCISNTATVSCNTLPSTEL